MTMFSKTLLPDLEQRVLSLIAEGCRDQEVAARLGLATTRHVHYRVHRIRRRFGLEAATQPQLVDLAYTLGALPAPEPVQPLVPKAGQYHLVRMVAAGRTLTRYAREQGLTRFQANYIARKAQTALDAATLPALIHRSWQRQILGSAAFAADLARICTQQPPEPDLGGHVIVPLPSGHRLALPAWRLHPTGYLDVPTEADAQATVQFLSGRDNYAPIRIHPGYPGGPYRVSWGRHEAIHQPRQNPVPGRPGQPPIRRSRSA